jgi:hypothetical protein
VILSRGCISTESNLCNIILLNLFCGLFLCIITTTSIDNPMGSFSLVLRVLRASFEV